MEWHEGQRNVQHHLKVVETAAKYQVAIDAHEPVKDTGLRRTYPNWIDREGARGMEYNAWGQFANGPDHEPTLVYTRMLSGPMDFTPGMLSLEGANHVPLASPWQLAYLCMLKPRPIGSRELLGAAQGRPEKEYAVHGRHQLFCPAPVRSNRRSGAAHAAAFALCAARGRAH